MSAVVCVYKVGPKDRPWVALCLACNSMSIPAHSCIWLSPSWGEAIDLSHEHIEDQHRA